MTQRTESAWFSPDFEVRPFAFCGLSPASSRERWQDGNVGVVSDGSKRVVAHHFSRACEGRQRFDLWSSYLLLRMTMGFWLLLKGLRTSGAIHTGLSGSAEERVV